MNGSQKRLGEARRRDHRFTEQESVKLASVHMGGKGSGRRKLTDEDLLIGYLCFQISPTSLRNLVGLTNCIAFTTFSIEDFEQRRQQVVNWLDETSRLAENLRQIPC